MGRKREPFDGSKSSPWHVLEAANAYYALSTIFTTQHQELDDGEECDMNESVASATNRILALELYMKAVLVAVPLPVPMEHDLVKLFNALPERMRVYFSRKFDEWTEAHPRQIRLRVESSFQLSDVERELELSDNVVILDPSLEALLERNKDGFVDSRYLFQAARWDEIKIHTYEYPRLELICKIICETLERDIQNRPSSYNRSFVF